MVPAPSALIAASTPRLLENPFFEAARSHCGPAASLAGPFGSVDRSRPDTKIFF